MCFVGVPKSVYRCCHSSVDRHSRRGMKTLGSLMPSVTSVKRRCEIPNVRLKVVRYNGTHPRNAQVEICEMVSFGVVKLPPLDERTKTLKSKMKEYLPDCG